MDKIILIGAGGHAKSVAEVINYAAEPFMIEGIIDKVKSKDPYWKTIDYLGSDDDITDLEGRNVHIGVGMIKNLKLRESIYKAYKQKNANFPVIISKHAFVSTSVNINEGSVVMHQGFVNTGAQIGVNCILNTKSTIEHDVILGDHCHTGPGSTINADCKIGNNVFISSNATINRGITIGDNCIIGAGSVVTKDIEDNSLVFGVPAKFQRKIK